MGGKVAAAAGRSLCSRRRGGSRRTALPVRHRRKTRQAQSRSRPRRLSLGVRAARAAQCVSRSQCSRCRSDSRQK
eukprot:4956652-Pleurochrysis_carterae.AAC.1